MARKVKLLMETLSWLEELDYSSHPLLLEEDPSLTAADESLNISRYTEADEVDESFAEDFYDEAREQTKRLLRRWRTRTYMRKAGVQGASSPSKPSAYILSQGMQLARMPAWRSFLLLHKSIRKWCIFIEKRKQHTQERQVQSSLIPRQVSKRLAQRLSLLFWRCWARRRHFLKKHLFSLWREKHHQLQPIKKVLRTALTIRTSLNRLSH